MNTWSRWKVSNHSRMLSRINFSLIMALIGFELMTSSHAGEQEFQSVSGKLDERNSSRLRAMLQKSQSAATKSLQEMKLLEILGQTNNATTLSRQSTSLGDVKFTGSETINSNSVADNDQLSIIPVHETGHSKNDARQSSLFSGFGLGSGGTNPAFQNPLMSGLFKPMPLPPIPTLPALTLRPPQLRPPKSSIIGGGSGPMTLTNDNVVVVNVFSNN